MAITDNQNDRGDFPYQKQFKNVKGSKMAYVNTGSGDPIVFLHGNPTSSYIWRNIIPYAEKLGRCIAPDLIGMGDSDKLADTGKYTFFENGAYLDALFDLLDIKKNIIFVVHDWGAALAFDWARRHPEAVKGIAYMESIILPRQWDELPPRAQEIFKALRSDKGEEMVLQQNSFIEVNLPGSIIRKLSEKEMENYRRPFPEPGETRRPMLNWARQLPIGGEPKDLIKVANDNGDWLANTIIPKLFIEAKPGTSSASEREFCKSWHNQTYIELKGHHNLQEDVPDEIGTALAVWIQGINNKTTP